MTKKRVKVVKVEPLVGETYFIVCRRIRGFLGWGLWITVHVHDYAHTNVKMFGQEEDAIRFADRLLNYPKYTKVYVKEA